MKASHKNSHRNVGPARYFRFTWSKNGLPMYAPVAHQTGIRWPHQSCLLIHQSRMFSSHMLYVLTKRSGRILMLPSATACATPLNPELGEGRRKNSRVWQCHSTLFELSALHSTTMAARELLSETCSCVPTDQNV